MAQWLAPTPRSKKKVPRSFLCGTCKLSLCLQWHLRVLWHPSGRRLLAVGTLKAGFGFVTCFFVFFELFHCDPELKQQYYFAFFSLFFSTMFLAMLFSLGSEWWLTVTRPCCAKPCALALPMLCPAQVLQQIVLAVSQEEDSTPLPSLNVTQGLVSVHPLQPFIQS